jgi:hypothetical protein
LQEFLPLPFLFGIRELEGMDFDVIGERIANGIAEMNAVHDVATQIPESEWK